MSDHGHVNGDRMKAVAQRLVRVLRAAVGMAPATTPMPAGKRSHAAHLRKQARRAERRMRRSQQQTQAARAQLREWKRKYAVARNAASTRTASGPASRRRTEQIERLRHQLEKRLAQFAAADPAAVAAELQQKLEHAEHLLRASRDEIDVLEVKLDLVAGAIDTLDRRYRTAAFAARFPREP